MNNLVFPHHEIKRAPVGSAVYANGEFDENMVKEIMFLIREEPRIVKAFGENPRVELRAGLFQEADVFLVAVLLRIGGEYYETWWNIYQTGDDGPLHFLQMSTQKRIPILFFTPEMTRSIAVRNSLAPFFQDASEQIAGARVWTMQEFDAARERIYARFPTVTKLWNHLGRIP